MGLKIPPRFGGTKRLNPPNCANTVSTNRVVVFDTNVCRALTGTGLATLIEAERRRGVAQYADPWVIMELLTHLADREDPDYRPCRTALKGLWNRCTRPEESGRPCGILNDSESQIVRIVTGRRLPSHEQTTTALTQACEVIALAPDGDPLAEIDETVRFIARHVAEKEGEFAAHLRESRAHALAVVGKYDEAQQKQVVAVSRREVESSALLRDVLARHLVRGAFRDVGLPVPDPVDPEMVRGMRRIAAVAIEFYTHIIGKAVFDGINPDAPRTRNLMWDHRISYIIGQELDYGPIWLVTDDPAFARAATPVGLADRVLRLKDYQAWLALS